MPLIFPRPVFVRHLAHFIAFKEQEEEPGGPQYPLYIASVALVYRLSQVNIAYVGAEYEQNRAVAAFGLHSTGFTTEAEAFQKSSRVMVFVADEFMFGRVGILLQSGIYVGNFYEPPPFIWYNKLGLRYYIKPFTHDKTQLYAGVYLKAHRIVAEYFGWGIGILR